MDFEEKGESVHVRDADENFREKTEIQKFYAGKTILLTGGTGFLGILLVEKLLRSCGDLKKIILILREKQGKSIEDRLQELFQNEVFNRMKEKNPGFFQKVVGVKGSCEGVMLDMNPAEMAELTKDVNIIVHAAATVQFDEPVRKAYQINVQGTKTLLQLAQNLPSLEAFVYVSTAYSQTHLPEIEENFYKGAWTDEEMRMILQMDDMAVSILTQKILNGRYNTYLLTKGISEEIVARYKDKIPVAIFRPSIVTSTAEEPYVCWTNNLYGATGVCTGTGVGFIRTLYCEPTARSEIIPADRVTNALIVLPHHLAKKKSEGKSDFKPIYNYTHDHSHSLTWQELKARLNEWSLPCDHVLWTPNLILMPNYFLFACYYYLLHIFTAPLFMLIEKIVVKDKKARLWNGYIRLWPAIYMFSFFMLKTWRFEDKNGSDLFDHLGPQDKILFNCNRKVDWATYFQFLMRGIGTYMAHYDWNKTSSFTIWRLNVCRILDYMAVYTFRFIQLWLLYKISYYLVTSIF